MRVLWILPYLPWPATSGGKTRQLHLIRQLARKGVHITLLVQSKDILTAEAAAQLQPHLERLIVLPRRSIRHPLTLLAGLLGPWPLLTCINGLSRKATTTLQHLLEQPWDQIQVEHSYSMQPYAALLQQKQIPFLLTEHNLESSLGGATYDRFPRWSKPFVRWDQWRARRWEKKIFAMAEHIIAVTAEDARAIRELTQTPVHIVVNGVDCNTFALVEPDPAAARILFLGNYDYPPNVEAVHWLLNDIMPLVWQQQPGALIAIAGHAMPAEWAQHWPDPRIEWQGYVEVLPELQRRCSLFVAPLRQGGGSKLKVLEAMAAGLPLVSTAQGVSGLDVQDETEYLQAETSEDFALCILKLLQQPDDNKQLSTAARAYVNARHDWQDAAGQLEHIYRNQAVKHACND